MYGETQKFFPSSMPALTKTELTFDFHRLNILLLRSVTLDSGMAVARKIATATMTDAKIHATVGELMGDENMVNLYKNGIFTGLIFCRR